MKKKKEMQSIKVFVLCAVLVVFVTKTVDGGCVNRSDGDDSDEEHSSVSDFFHNVGCSIRSGAKKVKDGVETGYNFIKDKVKSVTDGDDDEGKEVQAEVVKAGRDGQSQIPIDSSPIDSSKAMESVKPLLSVAPIDTSKLSGIDQSVGTTKPIAEGARSADPNIDVRITFRDDEELNANRGNVSLDDRAALNAPATCDTPGHSKDKNGICRSLIRL